MPNSPDALLRENEAEIPSTSPAAETNADFQARASTTILELRRLYGLHFAPGYSDYDTLGHLLGNAGLNALDEYLERHHAPQTPEQGHRRNPTHDNSRITKNSRVT